MKNFLIKKKQQNKKLNCSYFKNVMYFVLSSVFRFTSYCYGSSVLFFIHIAAAVDVVDHHSTTPFSLI